MIYDLVVEGRFADPVDGERETRVGIKCGLIERIGPDIQGKRFIHTDGLVFPGFGDTHVHARVSGVEPERQGHKEDYGHVGRAAIHGGVTWIADMPNPVPATTNAQRIRNKRDLARAQCPVDVLFYAGIGPNNLDSLEEMAAEEDVIGFKAFMSESQGDLFFTDPDEFEGAMESASRYRRPVASHCEDYDLNEKMKRLLQGIDIPYIHCVARPDASEIIAVERMAGIAERYGLKVSFCHVSTLGSLEILRKHAAGLKINGDFAIEVTPHHSYFSSADMEEYGTMLKMNPPLRSPADVKALQTALIDGTATFVGSDHAPHSPEEKDQDIWKAPAGVSGLDTYGAFIGYMCNKGMIPKRAAQLTSYNAARFFGLEKRGRIKEGYYGDLTILDKTDECITGPYYTKCGWSPFDGEKLPFKVTHTIYRGRVLLENGEMRV